MLDYEKEHNTRYFNKNYLSLDFLFYLYFDLNHVLVIIHKLKY